MPKRKKGAAPAQPQDVDIFAQLGWSDRQSAEPANPEPDEDEDKMKALEDKISALSSQLDNVSRTNTALLTQAPQVTPRAEPVTAAALDMKGLPDPVTDPEAYNQQLSERIVKAVEASTARKLEAIAAEQNERNAQAGRANALWEQFEEQYPDLAPHRDYVEMAAQKVTERALASGMDVQRYMSAGSAQFLADVAKETKTRYGKAIEAETADDGDDEPATPQDPRQAMAEKMNGGEPAEGGNRTAGIAGGVPTGAPGGNTQQKGSDFVADIHQMQRKLGLY